ncbi:MAG TPA: AraC family transcriptional regulator [Planctomycetota bacterium]|nr:AraC family transcriptional regulator [Planctomycetota bacterium]
MRVQELPVPGNVSPHDHDYYEICLIRRGTGTHLTEDAERPMRPGTITIIPPRKVHSIVDVHGMEVTNIYYLPEWLLTDLRTLWETDGLVPLFLAESLFRRPEQTTVPQFNLEDGALAACMKELADTHTEWQRPSPSIAFMKSSFLKFLILVSRAYAAQQSRELGFSFRREIWQALDEVEKCLAESRPLKVAALAKSLHLSTDHASKLFKDATGLSPQEYYQRRRIQQACRLLLNPAQSITDVGLALGYSDTAHLSRLFTRHVGMSPRQYRKVYLGSRS